MINVMTEIQLTEMDVLLPAKYKKVGLVITVLLAL
jgi:hypothetical protein